MKFIKINFVFFIFILTANAQWQPELRLTNDPAVSQAAFFNSASCIAASSSVVHAVWYDNRDGNYEVYYKRSTDGGTQWSADTRLTNNSAASEFPSESVSGQSIHIVWNDQRDGNDEVYYKRSTDGGTSWGEDARLTNNPSSSLRPTVLASGQVVHVVWDDNRDGNFEIYYKRSTNGGSDWAAETRLTNNSAISAQPTISISGSLVHIVWCDTRDGNYEIYYKRSTDGGVTWTADTRLTNNPFYSFSPNVSVSGMLVFVVWDDSRDGSEIYYIRSTDGGTSWGAETRLTNHIELSINPSLSLSSSSIHVVWIDRRDLNSEIYYKSSTDGGISWEADLRLTNSPAGSTHPSISVFGSAVHIMWEGYRDGNPEIYYKQNPTGNPVGINIINSGIPEKFSLSQNYPNPFNPTTHFEFRISNFGLVKLTIFDALGREIETIVNEELKPGTYEVEWVAPNYSTGIYYYTLEAADFKETKKMILLK